MLAATAAFAGCSALLRRRPVTPVQLLCMVLIVASVALGAGGRR
ncbi:hypothetical protein AB0G35_01685 [Streptomyces sp. NPDC021749]